MADSARWDGFEFRPDDIVISTPPKCGTTWTQMLCALLIFDGRDFPSPLEQMSPWLDMCNRRIEDVRSRYAAQNHRRFIKTHTPLDGLPNRDDVTYLVVGRDPRDVAISMEHHFANMNLERFLELRADAIGLDDLADLPPPPPPERSDPSERFRRFVNETDQSGPVNLTGVLHQLEIAWNRRHDGNVVMCHYADYTADLPSEMLRLAGSLEIELSQTRADQLAPEASLSRMRERAADVAPSASLGQWKDSARFFRAGAFGEWRERVTDEDLVAYERRVAELVPPELAAWAHRGRLESGIDPAAV